MTIVLVVQGRAPMACMTANSRVRSTTAAPARGDDLMGADRGHGDEVILTLEVREHGGDAVQAADVHVDHPVPFVGQQGVQSGRRHHTGVVDDHVDPAMPLGRGVGERRDLRAAGHVEASALAPARLDDGGRRGRPLLPAGADAT
jgi:hypothetical protein